MDLLISKIKALKSPISLRLSSYTIPSFILEEEYLKRWKTPNAMKEAIVRYGKMAIDNVYDIIPSVTIPSAEYIVYGVEGLQAALILSEYAKDKGLIVIEDCNVAAITKSDIRPIINSRLSMMELDSLYQRVYLNDLITMNPFSHKDFIKEVAVHCKDNRKGAFVLIKGNDDKSLSDNNVEYHYKDKTMTPIFDKLCSEISDLKIIGEQGYGVVGVSFYFNSPTQIAYLRETYPKLFFHVRETNNVYDALPAFHKGNGAVVDVSDKILNAHSSPSYQGMKIEAAIRLATQEMNELFRKYLSIKGE